MRKLGMVSVLVSAFLLAAAPTPTQQAGRNITRSFWVKPKPGTVQQFEHGVKAHVEWHRQQKDTWSWTVYEVEAGPELGVFVAVTTGHRWGDFDKPPVNPQADEADYQANVSPYLESVSSLFSVFREDISRPPAGDAPIPLSHSFRFHLNPGSTPEFTYVIRKIHDAAGKTNRPGNYFWLERVAGEETPTFILVLPHPNWADFEPQAQPLWEMMEEVYGRREADSLRVLLNKSIHCTSSYILRHRPDLSYTPPPAK